jgi:hypothetical protein
MHTATETQTIITIAREFKFKAIVMVIDDSNKLRSRNNSIDQMLQLYYPADAIRLEVGDSKK